MLMKIMAHLHTFIMLFVSCKALIIILHTGFDTGYHICVLIATLILIDAFHDTNVSFCRYMQLFEPVHTASAT